VFFDISSNKKEELPTDLKKNFSSFSVDKSKKDEK
jgi:hypothetical protein